MISFQLHCFSKELDLSAFVQLTRHLKKCSCIINYLFLYCSFLFALIESINFMLSVIFKMLSNSLYFSKHNKLSFVFSGKISLSALLFLHFFDSHSPLLLLHRICISSAIDTITILTKVYKGFKLCS